MLADTQSVTISGTPVSLPRVSTQGRTSTYESRDGALTLTVSHQNNKRAHSTVRLDRKKVGADALNPSTNKQYTSTVYVIVNYPHTGFTDAELKADAKGLVALIEAGTFWDQFLGQES